jgi:hypothetical protein
MISIVEQLLVSSNTFNLWGVVASHSKSTGIAILEPAAILPLFLVKDAVIHVLLAFKGSNQGELGNV